MFLFFVFPLGLFAQSNSNLRSDTIDVLDYKILLDVTDFAGETITANCRVKFESKINNVSSISLDLLEFNVDSVRSGGNTVNFNYNDTLLVVELLSNLNQSEIDSVTVYYSGQPPLDPSGFGGFYFQGDYAYNLGVGFQADPHNYGRTWHPCFDNFVERATYDITVISQADKFAYSNGFIQNEFVDGNGRNVRRWIMEESIPTYLACVSVAPYTHVDQTFVSSLTNSQTPVMLIAKPQDTTNLKASFANLFGAMDAFESNYGPYVWNKVAFALVPFNGGAMEHSTCIMYPLVTANGNLQFETLMAHELSHHWWGNLVTCETAGDMWINEGIASYSESIFLEYIYGYERYLQELKGVHRDVIQTAHLSDGAFYALSGVPQTATYGTHSYQKGATMMHNLRTYMGDQAFFEGLKYIQTDFAFDHINAVEFKNALEVSSGQDLDPFFDGFVMNPGFNGYEIDSFAVEPIGSQFEVTVYVQQKLFQAPDYFDNIPLEVTFTGVNWEQITESFTMNGQSASETFSVDFDPEMIVLNQNDKLLNAVTGEQIIIREAGMESLNYPYFFLDVSAEDDSTLFRAEHYRLAPDPIAVPYISNQFVISPERFWKIDGVWSSTFEADARFTYDARAMSIGFLDTALMTSHGGVAFHEDSVVLLWRPNQAVRWEEYPFYEINTFSNVTDGYGRIDTTTLLKGEYTFGFRKNIANTSSESKGQFNLYPNPSKHKLTIEAGESKGEIEVAIYDAAGALRFSVRELGSEITFSTKNLSPGTYHALITVDGQQLGTQQFIKQ
jgi:aminopeptidase N